MESGGKENTLTNTLETLKSIRARETTVGEVDKKVCKLIEELETKSEEAVLKSLVRSEVTQHRDAQKWRKNAFFGLGVSILLLACVFGLSILSVTLAKEVYVSEASNERNPSMTNNQGEVLATAAATKTWSLSMAPSLPDHLLKSITEITLKTPWNSTLSVEVVAREKTTFGIMFQTPDETSIVVTSDGKAHVVETVKDHSEVSEDVLINLYPQIKKLLGRRGKRASAIKVTCGQLKCASFSVKEDEELASKERRLALGTANECNINVYPYLGDYSQGTNLAAGNIYECWDGTTAGEGGMFQDTHTDGYWGGMTTLQDGAQYPTRFANSALCAQRCNEHDERITDTSTTRQVLEQRRVPAGTTRPQIMFSNTAEGGESGTEARFVGAVPFECPAFEDDQGTTWLHLNDYSEGHGHSELAKALEAEGKPFPTISQDTIWNDFMPTEEVCGRDCVFFNREESWENSFNNGAGGYRKHCSQACRDDLDNFIMYCKTVELRTYYERKTTEVRPVCESFVYRNLADGRGDGECCFSGKLTRPTNSNIYGGGGNGAFSLVAFKDGTRDVDDWVDRTEVLMDCKFCGEQADGSNPKPCHFNACSHCTLCAAGGTTASNPSR